ncbi:AP2-like ethylene-responsive transcription factor AIL7 [Bidens hawaiensis]|uniref:AP2-like ethylene-responsive transcription factor AIL7 n=1 Tax=Bidens hawaiensis TaxID=980011 RepID=UPI00404B0333
MAPVMLTSTTSDHNNNNNNIHANSIETTDGFQTVSKTNSGSSEVVDDSAMQLAELTGKSVESGNELTASGDPKTGSSGDKKSCKKRSETKKSIYRGVTDISGLVDTKRIFGITPIGMKLKQGEDVKLGGYDKEEKAARAYDLAALKYWGSKAIINFPVAYYARELVEMRFVSKQEFVASLRRNSNGFSRGASIYRGVTRHQHQGRWQARIGRVAGNKDLYLGTYATEQEAAEAYDIAAIKFKGLNAMTNFEINSYDVEAIFHSAFPVDGSSKNLEASSAEVDQNPFLVTNQYYPPPQHYGGGGGGGGGNEGGSSISFVTVPPVYALPFDQNSISMHHQSLYHRWCTSNYLRFDGFNVVSG